MGAEMVAVFIPIISVVGVLTLIGMKMRYRHLEEARDIASGQQGGEHLPAAVDNLRAEVELMREEFRELNDRVDFAERLLERPKTEG